MESSWTRILTYHVRIFFVVALRSQMSPAMSLSTTPSSMSPREPAMLPPSPRTSISFPATSRDSPSRCVCDLGLREHYTEDNPSLARSNRFDPWALAAHLLLMPQPSDAAMSEFNTLNAFKVPKSLIDVSQNDV
jgi:hypothetical protein